MSSKPCDHTPLHHDDNDDHSPAIITIIIIISIIIQAILLSKMVKKPTSHSHSSFPCTQKVDCSRPTEAKPTLEGNYDDDDNDKNDEGKILR